MVKNDNFSIQKIHINLFLFVFIAIIIINVATACTFPSAQSKEGEPAAQQEFIDPNARPYLMYFDSSADPTQNNLQVRHFIGHLHLAAIEDIFGDIQSLPLNEDCNYAGGPIADEGLFWYVTVTPDLVGVNLVSVSPEGTMSSAFDLDGDRIVDILDIRLADNRRISFVTENFGFDVFKAWLEGQDPFCNTELIQQLDLPNLGCDETGDSSSEGGVNSGYSGIVNPIDLMCSDYDTSPMAGVLNRVTKGQTRGSGPRRLTIQEPESHWSDTTSGEYRSVRTYTTTDVNTGAVIEITKVITDVDTIPQPHVVRVQTETVTSDGHGTRTIQAYNPDGTPYGEPYTEPFTVQESDVGNENYNHERTSPPPMRSLPRSETSGSSTEDNPGPEGDDSNIAAFCERRANYRSGVEQAAEEDPASMSVSCNDPVSDPGMPDDPNCAIIEWAGAGDFQDAMHPSPDDGCDPFYQSDGTGNCEPTDVIQRVRGLAAYFSSIQVKELNICPQVICDPALAVENRVYTKGDIEPISCPVFTETPTLEPSVENCPPGTYYAPVTNRCIEIQIPQSDNGNDGGGGCNLSSASCSTQGYSFDENKCECVPIQ